MPTYNSSSNRRTSSQVGPTLSEVTEVSRQILKFAIVALISYMVLKMLVSAFVSYWKATHPAPPPPPTVGFGVLPEIQFPRDLEAKRPEDIKLQLPTNQFPEFGDRAKVFFLIQSTPSLLADERAREIAETYNFTTPPEMLDSHTYRWLKQEPLETVLEINLKNYNFSLTSDYLSRPELVADHELPDRYDAVSQTKSFLAKTDLLPRDVATNSGQVTYLKALSGELVESTSVSDADFVQVDLDRYPIDGQFEMYTPEGEAGIIQAVLTGGLKHNESIVELHYRYQPVNYVQVETYHLYPVEEAWHQFQAGGGYIAQSDPSSAVDTDTAIVRDVYLGYFDAYQDQSYLQPIYVFVGDNDFIGYYPAIDPALYHQPQIGGK